VTTNQQLAMITVHAFTQNFGLDLLQTS